MWTHGTSVQIQDKAWETKAFREGHSTRVIPSGDNNVGWLHFAIPTPVMVDDPPLKAQSALLRFGAGPQASIIHFQVFHGIHKDAIYDQKVNYTNKDHPIEVPLTKQPVIIGGIDISIQVLFTETAPKIAYIDLIGAGIRFSS